MRKVFKILLVEDEIFLGQIVSETLTGRGFTVRHETNGINIFKTFREYEPDICLFDVMLPGKDGFTIAEEIRMVNKEIPIIFLTAKSQTEDVIKGFQKGCNDYIRKPFSMEELIVRIQALLNKPGFSASEANNEPLQIGQYKFFPAKQELIIGAETIKLTGREADLLVILVKNRNQLSEKKMLLMKLWGDDSFFNNRSMDVFVTKLRKYLSKDASVSILNIRGMGYKLVC